MKNKQNCFKEGLPSFSHPLSSLAAILLHFYVFCSSQMPGHLLLGMPARHSGSTAQRQVCSLLNASPTQGSQQKPWESCQKIQCLQISSLHGGAFKSHWWSAGYRKVEQNGSFPLHCITYCLTLHCITCFLTSYKEYLRVSFKAKQCLNNNEKLSFLHTLPSPTIGLLKHSRIPRCANMRK